MCALSRRDGGVPEDPGAPPRQNRSTRDSASIERGKRQSSKQCKTDRRRFRITSCCTGGPAYSLESEYADPVIESDVARENCFKRGRRDRRKAVTHLNRVGAEFHGIV